MANHTIHEPKDFGEILRVLEKTDPAHENTFNPLFERLINNDTYLKEKHDAHLALIQSLKENVGDNSDLITANKTTIVAAINEVNTIVADMNTLLISNNNDEVYVHVRNLIILVDNQGNVFYKPDGTGNATVVLGLDNGVYVWKI